MGFARQQGARFASPGSVEHTKHMAKAAFAASKGDDHVKARDAHAGAREAFETAASKTKDPMMRRELEKRAAAHGAREKEHAAKVGRPEPPAGLSGLARWTKVKAAS